MSWVQKTTEWAAELRVSRDGCRKSAIENLWEGRRADGSKSPEQSEEKCRKIANRVSCR